jgi:hypothetical protein
MQAGAPPSGNEKPASTIFGAKERRAGVQRA